jgi:hypothetical protein
MVSAENFMKVRLFTYIVIRSYKHDRDRSGMSRNSSIPTTGWGTTSPGTLYVCGGMPIRQCGPVHQVHRQSYNHRLEGHTSPQSRSKRYVTLCHPTPNFSPVASLNTSTCGVLGTVIRGALGAARRWNYELQFHIRKEFLVMNIPSA